MGTKGETETAPGEQTRTRARSKDTCISGQSQAARNARTYGRARFATRQARPYPSKKYTVVFLIKVLFPNFHSILGYSKINEASFGLAQDRSKATSNHLFHTGLAHLEFTRLYFSLLRPKGTGTLGAAAAAHVQPAQEDRTEAARTDPFPRRASAATSPERPRGFPARRSCGQTRT